MGWIEAEGSELEVGAEGDVPEEGDTESSGSEVGLGRSQSCRTCSQGEVGGV